MLKFLKKTEIKGKSVAEAKQHALKELGLDESEVTFVSVEEGSKGFLGIGAKDATVVVEVNDVVSAAAKKFLSDIFSAMGVEIEISTKLSDNLLEIELFGDELGIVIGKRGDTLDSIQYLTSLAINGVSDDYIKVTIDAENYRQKRHDSLISLSDRLAQKVIRTGKKHTLEPMNPYERRIIHSNLQSNDKVTTFSVGEEPYRKVVISPKNSRQYSSKRYSGGYNADKSTTGGYSTGYEVSDYVPSYSQDIEETEE